ncbi:MOSC domain-containing protein YiiM [Roseibium hamelinense]|uniref:MOSC domain-containing protein YiiM n=1 Tax=Roseibium hamelinense TaxID=150831 RepID=A0A562SY95_9HYPH|nr:MOSC domain-containing protein [Roseibium hamelinense]MTI43625.1 MOSC domain-containing protein [Roseibium hamelinense]TWI86143.1 MOSC domain-containing protein YiiM [Roseibium hamelinense]
MTTLSSIIGLYTGTPQQYWEDKPASAIGKTAVSGPVFVGKTGLSGDQQADLTVHGGPDKAIHIYPAEHYESWRQEFPEHESRLQPGGFGENIASIGLTEETCCIGDIFRAGSVLVQISQGRQPCWKLNRHTGIDSLAARFQRSCKTGWYFRVLEEGNLELETPIELVERQHENWTVARALAARFNPRLEPEVAAELADMQVLAQNWRDAFSKKCDPDFREDISRRLEGLPNRP